MKMPLLRYKKTAILLIAVILVIVLMNATAKGKYQLPLAEGFVRTVFTPAERVVSKLAYSVSGIFSSTSKMMTVYRDNEQLRQQVEQFQQSTIKMNELTAENQRLQAMLDYKKNTPQFDMVTATVIARETGTWFSTIVINKGSDTGLTKDMPVVTPKGLVGQIVSVYGNSAKVMLMLDPRSAAGGLVQRPESRVTGIVVGQAQNAAVPRMVNLARESDIIKGDTIVTSGLGGIFPKGILIGEVVDVKNEEGGLLKYAEIKSAVDFSKLEEVFVIRKAKVETLPPTTPQPEVKR
jgi:rod shape-determining protein MreC